jgi:HSP20 family protein
MEVFIMALIRWRPSTDLWDPFGNLADVRDEMNRLFDTSLRRHGGTSEDAFVPAMDIVEEKDNFLVKVDLPGLSKEDVSVSIQDGFLTIKGERKYDAEKKETNYYHRERVHGTFSRSLQLPTRIDAGKVLATFRDGVLHVTLPKSEEAKPKEIKVDVS